MEKDKKSKFFPFDIYQEGIDKAAELVLDMSVESTSFKYIVTPNADHLLKLKCDKEFYDAYKDAALRFADGWPVVFFGNIFGFKIKERVTGSDLVPAVIKKSKDNKIRLKVYILGGLGDTPRLAAENILKGNDWVDVVGYSSPPFGFESMEKYNNLIIDDINSSDPDFIIVGLGAPKQEKWVHINSARINRGVAICAGASVDFIAGNVRRAPALISNFGFEWLYRLIKEPKRMYKRYLGVIVNFPMHIISCFI